MAVSTSEQLLGIAKDIMSTSPGKAWIVDDVVEKAIALNKNLGLSAIEFKTKLGAALNKNSTSKTNCIFIKQKNKNGSYRKGVYKLKRTAVGPFVKINKVRVPQVDTLHAGAAGEYAVASQLLFWGFNVTRPTIDMGIDLWAEKAKHIVYIQVKTCVAKEGDNTFSFKINKESFESTSHYYPFYIFVMRSGLDINYAIVPFTQLSTWIKYGFIKGKDSYSIIISRDEKRQQYKCCEQDINPFVNDFKVIEPISLPNVI